MTVCSKDPSSWMNPQIPVLQLVPVWYSDHWISRKLFLVVGEGQMVPNHSFSFLLSLVSPCAQSIVFVLQSGKKIQCQCSRRTVYHCPWMRYCKIEKETKEIQILIHVSSLIQLHIVYCRDLKEKEDQDVHCYSLRKTMPLKFYICFYRKNSRFSVMLAKPASTAFKFSGV